MNHPKTYLRYLPAEGEIKRGDYNLQTDYSTRCSGKPVVSIWDGDKPPVNHQFMKFQRVERYAVTTDIAVGDEINYQHLGKWCKDECSGVKRIHILLKQDDGMEYVLRKDEAYKILAPISPHVIWEIKDGQEIEIRREIQLTKEGDWYPVEDGWFPFATRRIVVKGPCGHYH